MDREVIVCVIMAVIERLDIKQLRLVYCFILGLLSE